MIVFGTLLFSCKTDPKPLSSDKDTPVEITPEQKAASEAFTTLQLQVQGQHIYSTFPGITHGFSYDSSFNISQAELLIAMEKLLATYSHEIPIEHLNRLAAVAVQAQEEYFVEKCYGVSLQLVNGMAQILPNTSEVWILPNVQGRRDIILKW